MENLVTIKTENLNLGLMQKMTAERMAELFHTGEAEKQEGHLLVCIGSWAAYNEGGRHSLGTCYKGDFFIDFMALNGAEELDAVLDYLGWSEQEKEELFIQDYESDFYETENADYENPRALADLVAENRDAIQQDPEKLAAIMEATGEGLEDALDEMDNYIFYPGTDAEGYAEEMAEESGDVPEWLAYYVDYEKMGRDMVLNGDIDEVGGGVLARC